jgi:hypothetical protein
VSKHAREVVHDLVEAKLLVEVQSEHQPRFQPAAPIEQITFASQVKNINALWISPGGDSGWAVGDNGLFLRYE